MIKIRNNESRLKKEVTRIKVFLRIGTKIFNNFNNIFKFHKTSYHRVIQAIYL